MGKKDKKKKAGLGKAKTLEKTAKKEAKRAKKAKEASGEKDVEELLEEIVAQEQAELAVHVSETESPSPRVNFTVVSNPLKDSELVVFGGERFDGQATQFHSDLYRYSLDKNSWTRYRSKNQPPPRSSHAAAVHKSFMFIFGGEFSSPRQTQFYHYRDLWRLDMHDFSWEKIDARGGPTARSGHRMCVCRDKLFLFGGFFDNISEVRYLNDLYMIDLTLDEIKWVKVEVTGMSPSPRSGFRWVSTGDEIILYGGYCKETMKSAKAMSHKDKKRLQASSGGADLVADDSGLSRGIVYSEIWKLDPETKKWEKLKRSGYGPTNRSGFGMVLYKNQLVTFGGVEDEETEESLNSQFYNDIFAYNIARRKWYPMTLRRKKTGAKRKRRRAKKTAATAPGGEAGDDDDDDDDADGQAAAVEDALSGQPEALAGALAEALAEELKLAAMEANENAAAQGAAAEGALQEDPQGGGGSVRGGEEQREEGNENANENEDEGEDEDEDEEEEEEEEEFRPRGRMNAGVTLVKSSKLVIFGGMYEKGDQEIALDDIWTIDLGKLDEFAQVKGLSDTALVWNESDASSESGSDDDDEDAGEDDDGEEDDGEARAEKAAERQRRKDALQKRLTTDSDEWTPRVGETLKVFFERTKIHWMQEVYEGTNETGKENRRIAFQWARQRFDEIKPTLKELEELEEFFKEEKEAEERHEKKEADLRRQKLRR